MSFYELPRWPLGRGTSDFLLRIVLILIDADPVDLVLCWTGEHVTEPAREAARLGEGAVAVVGFTGTVRWTFLREAFCGREERRNVRSIF